MKKIILIGATLLATSSAILIANNKSTSEECCNKATCEQGVCKPGGSPTSIGSPNPQESCGQVECCKR